MRGRSRIAIIGAGAGGGSLAARLAHSGHDVVLIEAKAFPRAKVCGEFVSPAATEHLEAILSPSELLASGARRVDTLSIEIGRRVHDWPMPEPAWALSRRSLDDMLLERATEAGARVLQPARVTGVAYDADQVTLTLDSGEIVAADLVVHADGLGRHDLAGPTPMARGIVGLKCHARPASPIRGIRMRSGAGVYCGAISVENGLATYALCATPAALARFGNDRDELLASVWPGYEASQRDGDWLACGVARSGYIAPGHARSFRIGNAAAAVDPVGGEGIGLALWSAARLADLLQERAALEDVQRSFAMAYRARLRTRRVACRAAAEALIRPAAMRALSPLLAVPGLTIRPWYRLTGKPVRAARLGSV